MVLPVLGLFCAQYTMYMYIRLHAHVHVHCTSRLRLESHKQSLAVMEPENRKLKKECEHLQKVYSLLECITGLQCTCVRVWLSIAYMYMYNVHVHVHAT